MDSTRRNSGDNKQPKTDHTHETDGSRPTSQSGFKPWLRLLPEARSVRPVSLGDQFAQRLKELPNVYGVPGPRAEQQQGDGTSTTHTELWRAIYQGAINRARTSIESLAKLDVSRMEDLDDYCAEQAKYFDVPNKETYEEVQRALATVRKFKDPGQGQPPSIAEALNAFEGIKHFVEERPEGYASRLQDTLRELSRIDVPQNQDSLDE